MSVKQTRRLENIFISVPLGNNNKNTIEAVMLILNLHFDFLRRKGNAKQKEGTE
jgi:hypothetical protein